jgi:membrane-associated phospholipid phosphatase
MKQYAPLFLFILAACSVTAGSSQNIDINILKPINSKESSFKTNYLELNASSVTALSIGIPTAIAVVGFIKHDRKLKQDALYMGGAYIVSAVVTQSLKRIFNRPRPFEKYPFIIKRDDESGGLSFPSGHVTAAFCTATSIALRYHKWYYVVPSYLFAASVGWARMYQGVHYPSDVLAGALIGTGCAWLGWKMQKWMQKKHNQKR